MGDRVQYTLLAVGLVPVHPGRLTKVYFCGHCVEPDKPGFYQFWEMEFKGGSMTGRSLVGRDPGKRFRQQDARAAARTAILLRPSSPKEVETWLNGHPEDAKCAQFGEANGLPIMIIKDPTGHYRVR